MHKRLRTSTLKFTSVVPAALVTAIAVGACGAEPADERQAARATETAEHGSIAALRRPRGDADALPPFAQDVGAVLERGSERRLRTAGRHGLWIGPAHPPAAKPGFSASASSTCLQLVILAGRSRGGGGVTCSGTAALAQDPRMLLVLSAGRTGSADAPPHDLLLAGLVPDGVERVTLDLRGGGRLAQRVVRNAFLFHTTRIVTGLTYRTTDGLVRRRIRTCQTCDFGGRSAAPAPPAGRAAPG